VSQYSNISTNIISGFLGAGKTTAIKSLLLKKPASERWAVIVNEFGQVGVDGALLKNDKVEIKEIAGGCLCCVGSQSLSVGLNQIIRAVKPQRILIEPTGLGHPQKLVDSLSGEYYRSVLNLKAIINLLDARQLTNSRYTDHPSFIDQVALADVLVANKADTYSEDDRQRFYQYAASLSPPKDHVFMLEQAEIELEWLDFPRRTQRTAQFPHAHQHNEAKVAGECAMSDWTLVEGAMDGFYSAGWVINCRFVFIKGDLLNWLEQPGGLNDLQRIKGVLLTNEGYLCVNMTPGESDIRPCESASRSILEFISVSPLNGRDLDRQLKSLVFSSDN